MNAEKKIKGFKPFPLSKEWVNLNNQLCLCSENLTIKAADGNLDFRVSNQPNTLDIKSTNLWLIKLSINNTTLLCVFKQLPLNKTLKETLHGIDISALPTELLLLVLKDRFNPLLKKIAQKTQATIRISQVNYGELNAENYSYTIPFSMEEQGFPEVDGIANFNESFFPLCKQILNNWPQRNPNKFKNTNLNARIGLGATDITLLDLQSLSTGDMLISNIADDKKYLFIGSQQITCTPLENNSWKVLSISTDNNWDLTQVKLTMDKPNKAEETKHADKINIDDINLRLTFDIGDFSIPLQTLSQLTAGSILEIGEQKDIVNIRCNDKLIAKGEWVTIEGNTGVFIKEILS